MPASRISRATWSRPMSMPARRAAFHSLRDAVDLVVVVPQRHQPRHQPASRAARADGGRTLGRVVGARSHLQHLADGLDSEPTAVDESSCWRR